jgi:hypothetical protein
MKVEKRARGVVQVSSTCLPSLRPQVQNPALPTPKKEERKKWIQN